MHIKAILPLIFSIIMLFDCLPISFCAATEVRVSGRKILVNGVEYTIKGVGYHPIPVGRDTSWNPSASELEAVCERDFPLLRNMGCNTIRLWGRADEWGGEGNTILPDKAREYGIMIIAGFWIDPGTEFSDQTARSVIKSEFRNYVALFKNHDAILMWSPGNELNMPWYDVDKGAWYSLLDELAAEAHAEEGSGYHPVTTANYDLNDISAYYEPYYYNLDAWGANVYRDTYPSFGTLFTEFSSISQRPFWISEYGIDAWFTQSADEPSIGYEDEATQAQWMSSLWDEIDCSDVCCGGTVMAYSDEWWKDSAGSPANHDYGPSWGKDRGDQPDHFSNEEWYGIMHVRENGPNPDIMEPRQIYYMFLSKWIPNSSIANSDYNGNGTSDIAVFRSSSGLWAVRGLTRCYFGTSGDIPVPGDYDADGSSDPGVFRPVSGLWALRDVTRCYYGSSSDMPVPGDYDGDGCCDAGMFRSSSGLWAIRNATRVYFGASADRPILGDYDGDRTGDMAVFRGSSGLWALRNISRIYFGNAGDTVVPGDYDGDGTWAPAIFKPGSGLWALRAITRDYFGGLADQPVPADYDGDLADDIAIFRETSGLWAVRGITRTYYGGQGDVPVTR